MLKRIRKKIIHAFESQCIVLCYHRVGNSVNDKWGNSVSVDNFFEQMKIIKNYSPISIDQLVELSGKSSLPTKKCVIVTFDDGYEINCSFALDILEELNIPAIFYVNTYLLETDNYFWWDIFQNIFCMNDTIEDNTVTLGIENQLVNLFFDSLNKKEHNEFLLHRLLKGLNPKKRSLLIEELDGKMVTKKSLGKEFKPITKEGIRMISNNPLFEVGGHSHSHSSLGLIEKNIARDEIIVNKKILEEIIDKEIKHFSFPFGGQIDYDVDIINILKNSGYVSSVTTIRKPFKDFDNFFEIPRFSMKNWTGDIFKRKIDNYYLYR